MRTLDDLPINLGLYDTVKHGNAFIRDVKPNFGPNWKHRTRRAGGFWIADTTWYGETREMEELFLEGLMYEIRETIGSLITWEGFLGEMAYIHDGVEYVRSWKDIGNRLKAIFTRLGDNQFTNGSAETGAWTAYGTPTTCAQSTTWRTHGTYSCHIVTDAANEGATIQTGMTIVAAKAYEATVTVNIISGTWVYEIYRTDTGASLGSGNENQTGQNEIRASIKEDNTYAGTIGVRLYCTDATGEIYGDDARFQESSNRAETGWSEDANSQSEYGVIEQAILLGGMSDAAANGQVQTALAERSWPRTTPPGQLATVDPEPGKDRLELTFLGYIWTLRNKYTTVTGTNPASTQVSAMISNSEFLSAGVVESNAMDFQIDDRAPLSAWEIVRDATLAGDTSGNLWKCGGYANRTFNYQRLDSTYNAHYQRGRMINLVGGEMEPWLMEPGMIYLDDLPMGPGQISGYVRHDPHVISIDEVEFDVADWLKTGNGLKFRQKAS